MGRTAYAVCLVFSMSRHLKNIGTFGKSCDWHNKIMSVTDELYSSAHGQLFPLIEKCRKSEINLLISSSFTFFPSLHTLLCQVYLYGSQLQTGVSQTPAHITLWDAAWILQAVFSFRHLYMKAKSLIFPSVCFVFNKLPYVLEPRWTQEVPHDSFYAYEYEHKISFDSFTNGNFK